MTTRTLGAPCHAGSWRQARAVACRIAVFALAPAASSAAHAQLIAVKTAPIADGGQFAFLPSANLGMGGLSIALPDSTLDAFVNPAKGSRYGGVRVFGAPTFFSVSRRAGGGLTLPVGTSISSGAWFTQFAVAMQELDRTRPEGLEGPPIFAGVAGVQTISEPEKPSRNNRYVHGTLGRRFGTLSVAASASWWALNAMDGVDLYYPRSQSVRQGGAASDVRLGLFKEWRGQSFEALVVRHRVGMNHDVAFMDVFWQPSARTMTLVPRFEPNADRVETWGLHLGYTRPLADSGWRIGGIVTANRIDQPRMPSYDLPQVPADAGCAHAYDLGIGIARSASNWTFGVDAIFEPIWSQSWDRADEATQTRTGVPIAVGATTLDNEFRFTNGILRAGFGATAPLSSTAALTFEAGGQLRAVRYRLEQRDAVLAEERRSTQSWNEWTRSWGMSLRLIGAELRYRGNLTTGAGRPGFDGFGGIAVPDVAVRPGSSSFLPFNPTATSFDDVRVTTHQISLSVALR